MESESIEPKSGRMLPRLIAEPWFVDRVDISGPRAVVSGWSLPPAPLNRPPGGRFLINGLPFDTTSYPLPSADVGQVLWQREGSAMSGFECTIAQLEVVYPDGVLEVSRVRPDTPGIERGRDSWFVPDQALHADLPDHDQRFRVIGDRDVRGFLVSGATDYHRLDRALQSVCGKRLYDCGRVLDWGSGCGRVARHFPAAHCASLTGCDIDRDNVRWCSSHLRGNYLSTGVAPPLPFDDASFDVIYGVSVFTHLREAMQFRWLEELARIAAPGATLMMSVHGRTAIDFARLSPQEYWRACGDVNRRGIVVSGDNPQLDGHADHRGEYVNTFHSSAYIRGAWSRYFRVEHILPGYLLHQDLVILRKA